MYCEHIIIFYAILQEFDGYWFSERLNLFSLSLFFDKGIDVDLETGFQSLIKFGIILVLLEAEDVIDEG